MDRIALVPLEDRAADPWLDEIMKAYFITCHDSVTFVRDQFRTIYDPTCFYLYHIDAKASEALHETARRLAEAYPNVAVLPSRHYGWASYSQVATTLDAIDRALDAAPDWSHFIALSEQHCPLRDPTETAAALAPGVSYVGSTPFADMYSEAQADIANRSSLDYRELIGVGSFGVAVAEADPKFLADLRHGSNWYVLSREACVYLRSTARDAPGADRFRRSVHADENMIQTLLAQACGRAGTIESRETTFVAWPHITGAHDMVFREEDFFSAQADGWLFIRKRPRHLPERVSETLEAWGFPSAAHLTAAIGEPLQSARPPFDPEGTALARHVARRVVRRGRNIRADLPNLRYGQRDPLFSLQFQTDRMPQNVEVRVVSQTLTDFRILLLAPDPAEYGFSIRNAYGRETCLLRVRCGEFFLRREIMVPEDRACGFWTRAPNGDLAPLIRRIESYIDIAEKLGGQVSQIDDRGRLSVAKREAAARWRSITWGVQRFGRRVRSFFQITMTVQ